LKGIAVTAVPIFKHSDWRDIAVNVRNASGILLLGGFN